MDYIIHFIYSFFAAFTFTGILQAPRKTLIPNGIIGAIGWVVFRYITLSYSQTVLAALFSGLIIGGLSGITAIFLKMPALTLYLPSLIPIVPGGGMYYTMYYFILQDMDKASQKGVETLLVAISLATGTFVSTTIVNIVHKFFAYKTKKTDSFFKV